MGLIFVHKQEKKDILTALEISLSLLVSILVGSESVRNWGVQTKSGDRLLDTEGAALQLSFSPAPHILFPGLCNSTVI